MAVFSIAVGFVALSGLISAASANDGRPSDGDIFVFDINSEADMFIAGGVLGAEGDTFLEIIIDDSLIMSIGGTYNPAIGEIITSMNMDDGMAVEQTSEVDAAIAALASSRSAFGNIVDIISRSEIGGITDSTSFYVNGIGHGLLLAASVNAQFGDTDMAADADLMKIAHCKAPKSRANCAHIKFTIAA